MTRVLILGGSGHLGSALRARLPGAAFTHHRQASPGSHPFDFGVSASVPSAEVVIGAFPLARLLQDATPSERAASVGRYTEACRGARLIQLSTDAVYSGQRGGRCESDAPDPATPYGRAQAEIDERILQADPEALIVRTSFIFGWAGGRLDRRLAPLVEAPRRIDEQSWAQDVYRSPTEVNFLAEGVARALERRIGGILHIAGPRLSIAEFFAQALTPLGVTRLPRPVPETNPEVARDTSMVSRRMADLLGLTPTENWSWYPRFLPSGLGVSQTDGSALAP